MRSSAARACAYAVLRRTFEQNAYTDRAFRGEARGLDGRDRALAMRLAYGAVQRRLTLDHLAGKLSDRAPSALDPPVLAALRLGLYELLWSDAAAHAIVDDAVELAKAGRGGHKLVNAVLRRAARERELLLGGLGEDSPEQAALKHSVPEWIARTWWDALGADTARALLARANEPAEHALRANTLVTDATALAAELPVAADAPGDPLEAVLVRAPFDAHGSPLWREGAFMPQSRAAMLVAHALDPRPGERVLDLCAAPGGKTTHLAALMAGQGEIVAVDIHRGRARALHETARRMQAANVVVEVGDAARPRRSGERFDRVLVDPPCSGLGTLAARPDLRWRATPGGHAEEQARLLSAAAAVLAPGGTLVYSTCTIAPTENERQIETFTDQHPEFEMVDLQQRFPAWAHPAAPAHLLALPSVQGSDGFFIAGLRRR